MWLSIVEFVSSMTFDANAASVSIEGGTVSTWWVWSSSAVPLIEGVEPAV